MNVGSANADPFDPHDRFPGIAGRFLKFDLFKLPDLLADDGFHSLYSLLWY
jgi:hypothetical protein